MPAAPAPAAPAAPAAPFSPLKNSTLAGNYFISSYPPFSFWSEDQKGEVEHTLSTPSVADTTLRLSRAGLLGVDSLLHKFFLAHHRTSKIV